MHNSFSFSADWTFHSSRFDNDLAINESTRLLRRGVRGIDIGVYPAEGAVMGWDGKPTCDLCFRDAVGGRMSTSQVKNVCGRRKEP